jgi:hypothetical protein
MQSPLRTEEPSVQATQGIINGNSDATNPPGMVALIGTGPTYPTDVNDYWMYCGGTHIAPNTVLSAAHCFTYDSNSSTIDFSFVQAQVVEQSVRNEYKVPSVKLRRVARHPAFRRPGINARYGDLAIVRLEGDPHPSGPFAAIASEDFMNGLAIPSDATVHGWGITQYGSATSVYQTVTLDYLGEGAACHSWISNLADEQLCIGRKTSQAQGPCFGDSGGPAFAMDGTNFVQIGVVSGGGGTLASCGDATPDVYTSVARLRDFIDRASNGVSADVTGDGVDEKIFIWEGPSTLLLDVEKNDGTLLARLDTQITAGALRNAQVSYLDSLEVGQFVGDATNDIRVSFGTLVSVFEGGRTITDSPGVMTLNGLPTNDANDGRFLMVGGRGFGTIDKPSLTMYLVAGPQESQLDVRIFDADWSGKYDGVGTDPVHSCIRLVPDKMTNGPDDDAGVTPIAT